MSIAYDRAYLRRTVLVALALVATGAALYTSVTRQWIALGTLSGRNLAPWYSEWDPRLSLWTLLALGAGAGWLGCAPRLLGVRRDGRFVLLAAGSAMVLWAAVALSDGAKVGERRDGYVPANGLTMPFHRTAHEYIGDVPKVVAQGPRQFLATYHHPEVQSRLALHSRTHPPGPVLFLWGVERLLGPGPGPAAAAILLAGGLSLLLLFGLGREVLGATDARVLVLLMAATPGVVLFFATSMEAVFTALMLAAAWPLYASVTGLRLRSALLGGVLLGVSTLFTYASVLVAVWIAALALIQVVRAPFDRRLPPVLGAQLLGFAAPIAALSALGYHPLLSLSAALSADAGMMGSGVEGPMRWAGISAANGVAWAISLGVASLAVLPHPRDWQWLPEFTALVVVLVFGCFSSLFTLEVERIWLPLHGLALIALLGVARHSARPPIRLWLALLLTQTTLMEILAETRW